MCRPFVVVVDKIARTWLCSWNLSCLRRPLDLLIQTCFRHQQALPFCHQSSIHSQRHETVPSPHPKTRPFRRVLPYQIRHLGTTATPLRHMTEILPTIVLPRKPAAYIFHISTQPLESEMDISKFGELLSSFMCSCFVSSPLPDLDLRIPVCIRFILLWL